MTTMTLKKYDHATSDQTRQCNCLAESGPIGRITSWSNRAISLTLNAKSMAPRH